jgi:hypothetical protein
MTTFSMVPYLKVMKRTVVHFAWIWALIGLVLSTGCARDEPSVAAVLKRKIEAASLGKTNNVNGVSPRIAEVGRRTFSVPFRGSIKAKEERDMLVNSWEITYTIGDQKIRREAVSKIPLGKLGDLGLESLGIICDLPADRVLLYRAGEGKKLFTRMTVKEFEALIRAGNSTSETPQALSFLAVRPSAWKHIGTFFADFSLSKAVVTNIPDARTVSDLPCDLYTARLNNIVVEVSHCQLIKVERNLLNLVEIDLPAEVTGFPLLMQRQQLIPVAAVTNNASTARKLLQSGAKWAGKAAEKAMHRGFELLEITEQVPSDAAFTLEKDYAECTNLDTLNQRFHPPEGDHDDWD